MCFVLFSGTIGIGLVQGAGSGSVIVINAAPSVVSQDIQDAGFVSTTMVAPDATFYFFVTVADVDEATDILNTTILLQFSSYNSADDPTVTYEFCYNEALGASFQLKPATGTYLTAVVRTPVDVNTIEYRFEIVLNKTAIDTNGLDEWDFGTTVVDTSLVSTVSTNSPFVMGPFVEIAYWGNAGGMDFSWTGSAESNQSATFNTLITSNDAYELNASFTGAFGAPWGVPTLWIKASASPAVLVPDASGAPGTNTTWYSNPVLQFWDNQTHSLNLEFPAGLTQGAYSGVTIWIQARND